MMVLTMIAMMLSKILEFIYCDGQEIIDFQYLYGVNNDSIVMLFTGKYLSRICLTSVLNKTGLPCVLMGDAVFAISTITLTR